MDVAVARGCPGLVSFLASIGVASQDASNLGSYMMEASWPKFDGYWNIIVPTVPQRQLGAPGCLARGKSAVAQNVSDSKEGSLCCKDRVGPQRSRTPSGSEIGNMAGRGDDGAARAAPSGGSDAVLHAAGVWSALLQALRTETASATFARFRRSAIL